MNIYDIFLEMAKLPKGQWIEYPHDLIRTDFMISAEIIKIMGTSDVTVCFTRLSMKHLAEKGNDGEHLLRVMKDILEHPDNVHLGNFSNRFLISKKINFQTGAKPHIVTVEVTEGNGNIIVTGFIGKYVYFKNLKLLWGTASSPSQQSPEG